MAKRRRQQRRKGLGYRATAVMRSQRRNPAKGWGKVDPEGKPARRRLAKKHGAKKCFLMPKDLKFPICASKGPNAGKVDCRGLAAARMRACQHNYGAVAAEALRLGRLHGCAWAKDKKVACPSKPGLKRNRPKRRRRRRR